MPQDQNPFRSQDQNPFRSPVQALNTNPFRSRNPFRARSGFQNFARGVGTGLSQTGAGFVGLGGLLPGRVGDFFEQEAEQIRSEGQGFFDPQGSAGTAGQFTGRVLGEGATALGGGRAILGGLRGLSKGSALGRGGRNVAASALRGSRPGTGVVGGLREGLPFVPVDLAIGAANEPESRLRGALTEGVFGLGAGAILGGLLNPTRRRGVRIIRRGGKDVGVEGDGIPDAPTVPQSLQDPVPEQPVDELIRRSELSTREATEEMQVDGLLPENSPAFSESDPFQIVKSPEVSLAQPTAKGLSVQEEQVRELVGDPRRLVGSAASEQTFKDEVLRVKQALGLEKSKRSVANVRKAAEGVDFEDIKTLRPLTIEEATALENILGRNMERLTDLNQTLNGNVQGTKRAILEQEAEAINNNNLFLIGKMAEHRSDAGRRFNLLKYRRARLDNGLMNPLYYMSEAQRRAGAAKWNAEGEVIRNEINAAVSKQDLGEVHRILSEVDKLTGFEKFITYWKAGLLTNPKTHMVNITSNTTYGMLLGAADFVGIGFDRLISRALRTGVRTVGGTSIEDGVKTFVRGLKRGKEAFGAPEGALLGSRKLDVRIGASAKDFGARDTNQLFEALKKADSFPKTLAEARALGKESGNAIFDTYVGKIFGALSRVDQFFKGVAYERSIDLQARAIALNNDLVGEAFDLKVANLIKNPTGNMLDQAILHADVATFQDDSVLAGLLASMDVNLAKRSPFGKAVFDFIVPFKRTPSNIAARVMEFSPIGTGLFKGGTAGFKIKAKQAALAATGLDPKVAARLTEEITTLQRHMVEQLARTTTGTGLIAVGYYLAHKGLATGKGPEFGSKDRNVFDALGMQENSVLLGGQWHNVGRLAPGGNIIALGANMYELMNAEDATIASVLKIPAAALQTVADQPFVVGLREVSKVFQDFDGAVKRTTDNIVGSLIPASGVLRGVAQSQDEVVRETSTTLSKVMARLPFLSQELPARRNVFGEEIIRRPSGVIQALFNPLNPREFINDPALREMLRVGSGVSKVGQRENETPESFLERQQAIGQQEKGAALALIQSEVYANAANVAGLNPELSTLDVQRYLMDWAIAQARRNADRAFPHAPPLR